MNAPACPSEPGATDASKRPRFALFAWLAGAVVFAAVLAWDIGAYAGGADS